MHGYKEFFKDVEKVFSHLIFKKKPKIVLKSDEDFGNYAVEFDFKNSKLILDLDRMDLQCKFINIKDSKEYFVLKIAKVLNPEKSFKYSADEAPETRDFVVKYLIFLNNIIDKYLINVLEGDFSWSETYKEKDIEESRMIKKVLDLDCSDKIYQKFWNGDETWKEDLRLRLKNS